MFFLAGIPDIAAMKMDAISSRGTYKDFIDLYFILQKYSLEEVFQFVRKKFINTEYNEAHLLKSLLYFKDVEKSVKPKMIIPREWEDVVLTIRKKVKQLKL